MKKLLLRESCTANHGRKCIPSNVGFIFKVFATWKQNVLLFFGQTSKIRSELCECFTVELGTQQFYSFATATTRQRNKVCVTRKSTKNVKASVS